MARLIERAPASEILAAKRLEKRGLIHKTAHQIIFEGSECVAPVARSSHRKGIAKSRGAVDFHRIGRHTPSPGSLQLNTGRHELRYPDHGIMADGWKAGKRILDTPSWPDLIRSLQQRHARAGTRASVTR